MNVLHMLDARDIYGYIRANIRTWVHDEKLYVYNMNEIVEHLVCKGLSDVIYNKTGRYLVRGWLSNDSCESLYESIGHNVRLLLIPMIENSRIDFTGCSRVKCLVDKIGLILVVCRGEI